MISRVWAKRSILLAGFAVWFPLDAKAQTYTWNVSGGGDWGTASNWLGSVPPVSGSTATVELRTSAIPNGTEQLINQNVANPFELNQLALNARYGSLDTATTTLGLVLTGSQLRFLPNGGTAPALRVQGTSVRLTTSVETNVETLIEGTGNGHLLLNGVISGAGSLRLNRSLSLGAITILGSANNTFTGGLTLVSGQLALRGPAAGTASTLPAISNALGTGTLTFNAPSLETALRFDNFPTTSAGVGINNPIVTTTPFVFAGNNSGWLLGVISGPGGVIHRGAVGLNLRLANANSYTGPTIVANTPSLSGNTITLIDNGSILTTSRVEVRRFGVLDINNTGSANLPNRIADDADVRLGTGGAVNLTLTSVSNGVSTETIGKLTLTSQSGVGVVASGTTGRSILTLGNAATAGEPFPIQRVDGAVFFVRGTNLGLQAPNTIDNTANLIISDATARTNLINSMVGGGGSGTSATNISIIPWALGTDTGAGNPNRVVTYNSTNGFVALTNSQFATDINTAGATDNIRLDNSAVVNLAVNRTINSLVLSGTNAGTTGPGVLTINSGVFISAASSATGNFASIRFPGEGFITTQTAALTFQTIEASSAGLVKNGTALVTVTAPLQVPGRLTVNNGPLSVSNLDANFGSVTEILLNGGRLQYSANATLNRPIIAGQSGALFDVLTGATLTVSSNIQQSVNATTSSVVNFAAGTLVLSGNNQHTGSTIISAGVVSVGADANLGASTANIVLPALGTLLINNSFTSARQILLTGGSGAATINVAPGQTFTYTGSIDHIGSPINSFGMSKSGAGTWTINGSNHSFNGPLTVVAGRVNVNGVLPTVSGVGATTAAENSGVRVQTGGTLGGTGTVQRNILIESGGTLAPGNSVGTLNAFGYIINGGATVQIEVSSSVPRPGATPVNVNTNDRFQATDGTIVFNTGTTNGLISIDGTGQTFTIGNLYDYFIGQAASYSGFNASQWTITPFNFSTPGSFALSQTGSDLIVTFTPVPEPQSLALLAGLGALAMRRIRRKTVVNL